MSITNQLMRLPGEWIEGRLEQTDPHVSRRSIAALEERRKEVPEHEFVILPPQSLYISYIPQRLEGIAERVGLPIHALIDEITADLEDGLAIETTSWAANDGSEKFQIWGKCWKVVVRWQQAKNSLQKLAVLESFNRIDIPTSRMRLTPQAVRFTEIWNEQECDLERLARAYADCRSVILESQKEKQDLRRQIREVRDRRRDSVSKVLRELSRSRLDRAVRESGQLHGKIRRSYSALRVMMDLLRLRAENEQQQFAACVVGDDDCEVPTLDDSNVEGRMLRLKMTEPVSAGILEENSLVEIISATPNRWPKRAQIKWLVEYDKSFVLQLDVSPNLFSPGETVQVRTISRFGMRAHQRAVQDLLDERVEGHWPNLARLLCDTSTLAQVPTSEIAGFFNERLNDRQRAAVRGAVSTSHAFCIQGPPGTGKTTVICEIIQQLAARGERVLMVAPTHVAIDEVLRRIGSREGVRALRLSWDVERVADDVRKFTPASIIDPFVERAGKPDQARRDRWNVERQQIADAIARLSSLRQAQDRHSGLSAQEYEAAASADDARNALYSQATGLRATAAECGDRVRDIDDELARLQDASREVEIEARKLHAEAMWISRFAGWLGFGAIGEVRRQRRRIAKSLAYNEAERATYHVKERDSLNQLRKLEVARDQAEQRLMAANERLRDADRERCAAEATCREHPLIGAHELRPRAVAQLLEEFKQRDDRLASYQRLAPRFDELVAGSMEESQDLHGLRRDLLAVTNLFCCTTTGVAGSPELRDLVFDTLIVDEASRVTDSEFLIGAVRARRWILVGDENQLPPYVEQQDEHFLHALSALHRSETLEQPLDQAVDELGNLWEEDEELHRFRRDSVLKLGQDILGGDWQSSYRAAYQKEIDRLKQDTENPTQTLLRAMRDNLVRSLFERVVRLCPTELKIRLIEQRRMIDPIAAIVSAPVYQGEYSTPPQDDLAAHGVKPLITPTFPPPVTFLDTSLLGIKARDELVRNSFMNRVEAEWIVNACRVLDRELAQARERLVSVSILAFYKAQARLIRDKLARHQFSRLHFSVIDAIDRIQGQESDLVFLSFCRTCGRHVSPTFAQWLQDIRRLNVACTRAHRALVFVGQKEMLGRLCANEQAREFYCHLNSLFETRPDSMRVVRQFGGAET